MANINQAFPSNYVKASDLSGNAITVQIRDVKFEQVGRDRDNKLVVYFEGKQKGMVLNKTNARKIAEIAGSADTDDWPGISIVIFPTETEFAGESVECIRVRAPKQATRRHRQPGEDDVDEFDSSTRPQQTAPPPAPVPPTPPPPAARANTHPITDKDIPFAWLLPIALPLIAAGTVLA